MRLLTANMRLLTAKGIIELTSTGSPKQAALPDSQILDVDGIKISPNEPGFYNSCGEAYRALDKFDLAITCYKQALAIDPYFAEAHYNFGLALQELGRQEDAIPCYEQALAIVSNFAEAHNNLGVVLHELGRQEEAISRYEQALVINPYLAEAHNNLGVVLKVLGKPLEAIIHHQTAMRLRPGETLYYIAFAECLSDLQVTRANDAIKEDIITTFSLDGVNHQDLEFSSTSIIKLFPGFQELNTFIEDNNKRYSFQELFDAGLGKIYSEPLLLALLKKTIIRDPVVERILTKVRSSLLHMAIEIECLGQTKSELISFIYALARQCFFNEYVYGISEIEAFELQKLRKLVASSTDNIDDSKKILVAILACYIPLCNLKRDDMFIRLIKSSADNEMAELVIQQILEVNEEKRLRNKIETIGIISDKISQKVRTQYEENPYPRWLGAHKLKGETVRRVIKRLFPHISQEQILDNQGPDILVAGCATGRQVINRSLEIYSSKVLGVDISLSSLAYAKRKAIELEITNVEFKHVDILNLHLLNKSFDIIECIGVLHHMDDPVQGWRVLANLLKPGGFMRIGLYSEIARKDIIAAQSFIVEKGYTAHPDSIRKCRQDIFLMPNSSNVRNVTKIIDFYTLSETRDLLFHVQEKRFTVLQIAEIIDELGLDFIGFEFNNPLPKQNYLDLFPDDPTATSLHNWHKYEQINTKAFIGLYLFWVQKRA